MLRALGILYLGLLAILVTIHVLGGSLIDLGDLLLLVWCAVFVGPIFMAQQVSWITLLPVRKREILYVILLSGFTLSILVVALSFLILATGSVIERGNLQLLYEGWNHTGEIVHQLYTLLFISRSSISWASVLGVINVLFFFWFIITFAQKAKLAQATATGRPSNLRVSKKQWPRILVMLFIGVFFWHYLVCGVGIFLIAVCSILSITQLARLHLGVFGNTYKRWTRICLAIILIQVSIVALVCVENIRSPQFSRRIETALFLRPWMRPSLQDLTAILESDASWTDIHQYGTYYLDHFKTGLHTLNPASSGLNFEKAIRSKSTLGAIYQTLQLFDPAQLGVKELKIVFSRFEVLHLGNTYQTSTYLLPARITPTEMVELLKSDNHFETNYAVYRARFYRDEAYLPVILRNVDQYTNSCQYCALESLSLLAGQKSGLNLYRRYREGRLNLDQIFIKVKCDDLLKKAIADLKPEDEGEINICVREKVRDLGFNLIDNVNANGWIKVPFGPESREILTKVMGMQ
jgi:hypothetical protein